MEDTPEFSKDSRYLAFAHSTQSYLNSAIYIKDLESNKYLRLTNGQFMDINPQWSKHNDLIYLRNMLGRCEIKLNAINKESFSSDGETTLFTCSKEQSGFS